MSSQTRVISVLLADDHELLRRGLAELISKQTGVTLCGETDNLADGLRDCVRLQPDIVIFELQAHGMNGVEFIHSVRAQCPNTRIMALTNCVDEQIIQAVIEAGVTSYLLKKTRPDALTQAIYDAYAGKSTLTPEATQALVHGAQRPAPRMAPLTRRERDVLALLMKGCKNTEIAESLTVSRSTVKKHVSSILSKLDATSRTEAVAVAMQNNLTSDMLEQ